MGGKYIEQAGGTISEIAQNDYTIYAEGNIITNAKKSINEVGEDNGVSFGSPSDPPATTKVSTIKLMGVLDDGSANDGTGNNYQKGLVFGNAYEFKVTGYTNGEPINKSSIKWMIKYQSPQYSFNKSLEIEQHFILGDSVIITMNDKDMCGCDVLIRAYISDPSSEGELKLWMHNRFRFFDRKQLENEVEDRTTKGKPWMIDQGGTPLCGVAIIFYLLAKKERDAYKKSALELHRIGFSQNHEYVIEPSDKTIYEMNPSSQEYPSSGNTKDSRMPRVDWITMVSARNKESLFGYTGKSDQVASAINLPSMVVKFQKELLGYSNVIDNTYIVMDYNSDKLNWLIEMQKAYQEGYSVSILIDSDMLKDKPSHFAAADNPASWRFHWIIYEGGLFVDDTTNTYTFSYWCWGDRIKTHAFKKDNFNSNFFGYIKGI